MDVGGANNIHGLPGILSGIAAAIAAGIAGHNSSNGFIDYGNRCIITEMVNIYILYCQ